MSRNVRKLEKNVISVLHKHITDENQHKITQNKKGINFNENVYTVIEKTKSILSKDWHFINMAMLIYNNKKYIFIPQGLSDEDIFEKFQYLNDEDILNGFAMIMITEAVLMIKKDITDIKIIDAILGWDTDKTFECPDILAVFEKFNVIEIEENVFDVTFYEDFSRLECIMKSRMNILLGYNSLFYNMLYDLLFLQSSRCITNMMCNIFLTSSPKLIFLQLYQMLEYLFIIQRADEMSKKYEIEMNDLINLFGEENLRFPENISLKKLIDECTDIDIINNYIKYIEANNISRNIKIENKNEKVSEYIYKTRCKIAHYKFMHENVEADTFLQESNVYLVKLVKHLFEKFDEIIKTINSNFEIWDEIVLGDD